MQYSQFWCPRWLFHQCQAFYCLSGQQVFVSLRFAMHPVCLAWAVLFRWHSICMCPMAERDAGSLLMFSSVSLLQLAQHRKCSPLLCADKFLPLVLWLVSLWENNFAQMWGAGCTGEVQVQIPLVRITSSLAQGWITAQHVLLGCPLLMT